MQYENRVVVYLDILGFKELIDGTVYSDNSDNDNGIEKIINLYELIYQNWDLSPAFSTPDATHPGLSLAKENAEKGKIVTIFSDTVVISFPQTAKGEIFWTLMEIRLLLVEFANRGLLCRGAVSFGKLIHNERIVFGPALVDAYLLESQKAVFPRVLISQSVLDIAQKPFARMHKAEDELQFIHDLINKDDDGYYYIDYLEKVQSDIDDPEFGYCDYLMRMRGHILKGLSNLDQKVIMKFEWLRNKFNRTLKGIHDEETVRNLLDQGRKDLVDYYSALKTI